MKILSYVLAQVGLPMWCPHCPEGDWRGASGKAERKKGNVSGGRWTSPTSHGLS